MSKMVIGIIIAIVAAAIGLGSYYWLGPDNAVEEECEKVIKDETGMDIDLSPSSTPSQSSTSSTSGSTSSPSTSL